MALNEQHFIQLLAFLVVIIYAVIASNRQDRKEKESDHLTQKKNSLHLNPSVKGFPSAKTMRRITGHQPAPFDQVIWKALNGSLENGRSVRININEFAPNDRTDYFHLTGDNEKTLYDLGFELTYNYGFTEDDDVQVQYVEIIWA